MTSTTVMIGQQNAWTCSGAPQSTIVLGNGGAMSQFDLIIDTNTGDEYVVTNLGTYDGIDTYTGCAFSQRVSNQNISVILSSIGLSAPVSSGDATLSLGAATVSLSALASGQKIILSYKIPGGTSGAVFVSSFTAGIGFHIGSTSLLDNSTIHWEVFN